MKKGFKDPIAIKKQSPEDKPKDGKQSLGWDARCPQYDQRSSGFIKEGTNYSVGHRQPVGHFDSPKLKVDVLPYGCKAIDQQIPQY